MMSEQIGVEVLEVQEYDNLKLRRGNIMDLNEVAMELETVVGNKNGVYEKYPAIGNLIVAFAGFLRDTSDGLESGFLDEDEFDEQEIREFRDEFQLDVISQFFSNVMDNSDDALINVLHRLKLSLVKDEIDDWGGGYHLECGEDDNYFIDTI